MQGDLGLAHPVEVGLADAPIRLHLLQRCLLARARCRHAALGRVHLPLLGLDRVRWRLVAVDDAPVGRDRLVERLRGRGVREQRGGHQRGERGESGRHGGLLGDGIGPSRLRQPY